MTDVFGQQDATTTADDFNTLAFVFELLLQKVQTATLVQVISCTNDGGLTPVGTVTVQPLVNQMTGKRQAVPHGPIFNCVYSRITGGDSAVIMDPIAGDIGLMAFCSRDISGVRANAGPANPSSFRMFDWADGVYVMAVPLGKTPSQYVRFSSAGIELVSPTKITLQAPVIDIEATSSVTINSPSNALEGGGTSVDGKPFLPHTHTTTTTGNPTSGVN